MPSKPASKHARVLTFNMSTSLTHNAYKAVKSSISDNIKDHLKHTAHDTGVEPSQATFRRSLGLIRQKRIQLTYLWLGVSLVVSIGMALSQGAIAFAWSDMFTLIMPNADSANTALNQLILWQIRVPRIVLALFIGSLLASCGVLTQGLFRNPLADPSLIGITAGASAGASIAIAFGLGTGDILSAFGGSLSNSIAELLDFFSLNSVSLGAFLGALGTMCLVYALARQGEHPAIGTLLMTGLALTAFVGGFTQLLSNLVDDATLRQLSLWHMGGLGGATANQCALAGFVALGVFLIGMRHCRAIDALALGETQAASLGVPLSALKHTVILVTAAGIGISVTLTGTIAFIGLVVPHIMRNLIGPKIKHLLPTSCLAGALLLLLADTLARTVLAPTELPVGVLTTLLGAPFFLLLLLRKKPWLSDF